MSIPPGSLITEIDFLDPACFTNGGTSVTDLSGSGNNFTLNNTSYTYNSVYGSLDLPIGTQLAPNNVTFLGTGVVPFTMNMWHYATATSESIFYNGCYPGDGYFGPQCYWNGTNLIYRVNTYYGAIDTGIYSINTWHMFTVEYDGTTLKIYIDGVYAAGSNRNLNQTGARTGIAFSNLVDNTGVNGLALINVYDVAIGAGDILALFNEQKIRFGLNLYFSLDAADPASYPGSGSTWTDTASNIAVTLSGTSFVSDFGGAITFPTAASGSFPVNASFPLGNDPVTINMWIKFNQMPQSLQDALFVIGNPAANDCHFLFLLPTTPTNPFGFNGNIAYDMAGPLRSDYGPLYSVDGLYHQLTTTYDGATMKTYWDGQFVPNSNFSNVGALTASVTGYIGSFNGATNHASFTISQLELYDNGFSALEVEELYDAQKIRYDNLMLSYDFSDPICYPGTGNTVFDLSGSSVNATITGATFAGTGQSKYFSFDGIDNIIVSDAYDQSSKTVFTYNVWTQFTSTDLGYITITGAGALGPSGGGSPVIAVNEIAPNGEYRFNFGNGIAAMTAPGTINTWQMLTVTADGTTVKFYINGTQVDSAVQGTGVIDSGPQESRLGGYGVGYTPGPASGYYDGNIAIYEYYDTALSAGDITTIYNDTETRFFPPAPPAPSNVGGRQFAQGFNG